MTNDDGSDKRIHGLEAAAAGDLGDLTTAGDVLGPCPSCRAILRVVDAMNPSTGRVEVALIHPVPFCTYFGETDAEAIERAVLAAAS